MIEILQVFAYFEVGGPLCVTEVAQFGQFLGIVLNILASDSRTRMSSTEHLSESLLLSSKLVLSLDKQEGFYTSRHPQLRIG